ncbi:NAD(P)/FAD-dependent oxidoreductase [Pseudomonas sp. R4-84]
MSPEIDVHTPISARPDTAGPGQGDLDCLVIGAGPAGLTTAVYLGRFHRKVLVADGGPSRASLIPVSHNYPGFPPGISGSELLARLREQAKRYGARIEDGRIESLIKNSTGFIAQINERSVTARRVVLATGIVDTLPHMERPHDAVAQAIIRLCPICDGYEVNGDSVAVYGEAQCAVKHALFLRSFTDRVTVLVNEDVHGCEDAIATARDAGIKIVRDRVTQIEIINRQVQVATCNGESLCFDVVYPSLGSHVCSDLAMQLGAEANEEGALRVDSHQGTSVSGLYAVGDVVDSLKQISVAIGQAAVCATAVHNSLPMRLWNPE